MIMALALLSLTAWIYLVAVHSGFWRADQRLPSAPASINRWPSVVAIVPARNEAPTIGACVSALLSQDYPGSFRVVVVDDHSADGTAQIARAAAAGVHEDRLTVMPAPDLEAGWTGKLWALHAGIAEADRDGAVDFLWLTDADIVHAPDTLRRLTSMAEEQSRDLVSLMVGLHCATIWEKAVIPAFVFFFQMLYPFRAVNDDRSATAAAAGGCVLLRREALIRAGGLAAVRNALIDDCALAKAIKTTGGRLWLGLTEDSRSLRAADRLGPLWDMVKRSAFTQLHHSYLLLFGTTVGLLLIFAAPPVLLFTSYWHGQVQAAAMAGVAWLLMGLAYGPTLRSYGLPSWVGLTLPITAVLYGAMTVDSGVAYWRGHGGTWKGRHYDSLATPPKS